MALSRAAAQTAETLKARRALLFRIAQFAVPFVIMASAVWMRAASGGFDEVVSHKVFDEYQRLRPRPYEDVGVRVIDIDDESLSRLGQWPWPRTTLARLVEKLHEDGAAAIAFDAVFAEPDRASPARAARDWRGPDAESIRRLAARLPDNDEIFARALRGKGVVLGVALSDDENGAAPMPKAAFGWLGEGALPWVPNFPGAVLDRPVLERSAAGLGSISFLPEPDGIIRRVPLLSRVDTTVVPALSVEALRVAAGDAAIKIKTAPDRGGLLALKTGPKIVPVDAHGRFWVYYTKEGPKTIPAHAVLEPGFDKESVRGAVVFVGTSALGLKDMRATPLRASAPGVIVHANLVEDILTGRVLQRPFWAARVETYFLAGLGLLLVAALPWLGAGWCGLLALAAIGAAVRWSWSRFVADGVLIDPVYPGAAVFLTYFSSSLISYLRSESERRQVKTAMSRYMAPALVEQLAKHPEKLKLGGEMREMTFHFCDIRGFTTISEQFDPHGLTLFINRFLTPMTDIILRHQGVIDKYMGDCIMAFWNAPLDDAEHARHACQAALAMHKRLEELNAELEAEAKAASRKFIPIHIGTGLNTGRCVVGNMGSDQRFDYSVLGDDVNLASRLEGQSKTYGVGIVIGPRTREKAPEFASLELDLIKVKGKTVPVNIYTLVGGPELSQRFDFQKQLLRHNEMLAAYRARKWDEALSLIKECRGGPVALETLYGLYESRVAAYRQAPPPADWDGAYTATSK